MLSIALEAARAGARVLLDAGLARRSGQAKQPGDYVTDVDRTSEEVIADILRSRAPDIPVLGEEMGGRHAPTMWARSAN